MNIFDLTIVEKGGLIVWPLLLISFIGTVLFVERILYLHKGQIKAHDFLTGLKNLLQKRRLIEALTVCEETPGPVPNVVKAALLHYDEDESKMRNAIQEAALIEIPNLERRIGSIAAIARIGPLLGLLGTTIGVLKAFQELHDSGAYSHVNIMSIGVGEALISTALGLSIASIAYLAHHFLHGRMRAIIHDMEWAGHDIMQFLLRGLPDDNTENQK